MKTRFVKITLCGTFLGLIFTPVLYVAIQGLAQRFGGQPAVAPAVPVPPPTPAEA